MKIRLKLLDYGTQFTFEGKLYKSSTQSRGDQISCEPYLGGKFQTARELNVWIDGNLEVDVT